MAASDMLSGNRHRVLKGVLIAVAMFAVLGTVSALWSNPIFIRMTPAGWLETAALATTAILSGIYVAVRRPACSVRLAGSGGVLGFLGVACPTCNKILMLAFGGPALMAYFEPVRIYVALAGALMLAIAVVREIRISNPEAPSAGVIS